jgi:hypothetical protein
MLIVPERTSVALDTDAEWRDAAASPYAKWQLQAANVNSSFHTGGVHHSMSTRKIFGQEMAEFKGSDDNVAAVTTVPAEEWFWTVAWHNLDGSTTVPLHYMVQIDYDVEFFERVLQTIDAMERIVKDHQKSRDPAVRHVRRAREKKEAKGVSVVEPPSENTTECPATTLAPSAPEDSSGFLFIDLSRLPAMPRLVERKERKQN